MFTPFGWVLPFQRVFGMGHLAAPTGEGGDEGEGATNIITGHFQQTPPNHFPTPHVEPETGASVLREKGMVFVRSRFFCNMAFLSTSTHPFVNGKELLGRLGVNASHAFLDQ